MYGEKLLDFWIILSEPASQEGVLYVVKVSLDCGKAILPSIKFTYASKHKPLIILF